MNLNQYAQKQMLFHHFVLEIKFKKPEIWLVESIPIYISGTIFFSDMDLYRSIENNINFIIDQIQKKFMIKFSSNFKKPNLYPVWTIFGAYIFLPENPLVVRNFIGVIQKVRSLQTSSFEPPLPWACSTIPKFRKKLMIQF